MSEPWHFYLMACLYLMAGLMHFIFPKTYLRIMPDYLPGRRFLVMASGAIEILLAAGLCFPGSRKISIYGIIVVLSLFFMVHINMLTNPKAGMGLPRWSLILRLPLQFALMYWAYFYLS
jgi:uncharacterized membrane protein